MDTVMVMKALSDGTRFKIIEMLLSKNYCVQGISRKLGISESAVSQHIKILKEADLLIGTKSSYYVHYDVNRELLKTLSVAIALLSKIERTSEAFYECGHNCRKKEKCGGGDHS